MALEIKTRDRRHEAIGDMIRLRPEKVYIWGGGAYSRNIRDYLRSHWEEIGTIITVVDDEYWHSGCPQTLAFSQFLETEDKTAPIVFGFYNYKVIRKKKEQWGAVLPHLFDFHLTVVNGKPLQWEAQSVKNREPEYRRTYELLSDERSRNVMQRYLNAATAGEFHELFTECFEEPSYFNRITSHLHIDTLIDCGAYDGDSIHDFVAVFPDYRSIIAVEPDPGNLKRLLAREERESIRDVHIIQKGLGSREKTLHFRANGESNSYLDEAGDCEVQVTTLDRIASECGSAIGPGTVFLKMDIEGAELDALRGAQALIRERHPVLAICVYHREEDLIEIPRLIHELAGEGVYEYYLGFHGLDLAELVFYAIPGND